MYKLVVKIAWGILCYGFTMTAYAVPDLVVGTVSGNPGATVSVPIKFTNNVDGGVVGMDFKLNYDPGVLKVEAVDLAALEGNISNHANDADTGIITFLIAKFPLQAISDGSIQVKFIINKTADSDSVTSLDLKNVTFSNNVGTAVTQDEIANGSVKVTRELLPPN